MICRRPAKEVNLLLNDLHLTQLRRMWRTPGSLDSSRSPVFSLITCTELRHAPFLRVLEPALALPAALPPLTGQGRK
jgi:hypothetical protein